MLRQVPSHAGRFLAVAALAAGVVASSCGGAPRESIAGPAAVAARPASTDEGTVTASAALQAVCHYDTTLGTYTTLSLPALAVAVHLRNHAQDYGGACGVCPCFTAADFACSGTLSVSSCSTSGRVYEFSGGCSSGGPVANLGPMSAGETQCSRAVWSPVSGGQLDPVTATGLKDGQVAACQALIVAACPKVP